MLNQSLFTVQPIGTLQRVNHLTNQSVMNRAADKVLSRSSSVMRAGPTSMKVSNSSFVPSTHTLQNQKMSMKASDSSFIPATMSFGNQQASAIRSTKGPQMSMASSISQMNQKSSSNVINNQSVSKMALNTSMRGSLNVSYPYGRNNGSRVGIVMQASNDESNESEVIEVAAVEAQEVPMDEYLEEEKEQTENASEENDEPVVSQVADQPPSDVEEQLDNYTLYYFNAYGRAEPIRLLLNHAGVQFTDKKYERKEWKENKKNMPGKKVPVLELGDGTKIGQSVAILRFLGKKYGYYPEDPLEAHKCDYLIDCYNDKFLGIALNTALPDKVLNFKPPMLPGLEVKLPVPVPNKAIPQWIEFLEPYLKEGEFLCGEKLTIADFVIGGLYTNTITNKEAPFGVEKWSALLKKYPNFEAYGKRFEEANTEYLSTRTPSKM